MEGSLMNIKKRLFSTLFMILLVLVVLMKNSAVAQSTTDISVINPSTGKNVFIFYTNVTSVGFRFNATVWVSNVNDLYAYQVHLNYNATLLNATRAWLPTWNSTWVFYDRTTVLLSPVFKANYVEIGDAIWGIEETFNGTGLLAVIEFEVIKAPLKFQNVSSAFKIDNKDTILLNFDLEDIPATKTNGFYEYNWPPRPWLEVTPTLVELGPYPPAIGKHFDITVWLKGLEASWKLVNVAFGLTYNSTLIQAINATEGPFMKEFGNTKFFKSIGTNRVNVINLLDLDSLPATYPNGEGAVATIQFNVTYQGTTAEVKESPLILVGINLTDKNGEEIPLNATKIVNGLYRIESLPPSTINLIVAPTTVTVGSNVTITGAITPTRAEVNVTIYYSLDGENWATLKIVKTNADGIYTYDWKTAEAGSYQLKAYWPGDTDTLPDESDVRNVNVEAPQFDLILYILIAATVIIALVAVGIYYWKVRKPELPE